MKRTISNILVIGMQFLIVGLFFMTIFNRNVNLSKQDVVVYNNNLNKIANSVSILFKDENIKINDINLNEVVYSELPSLEYIGNEFEIINEIKEEESTPLYTISADKYINNESMGFIVTENNKNYFLSDDKFDVVVAVVSAEFDRNLNDALGVVSVILNRCDSDKWVKWAGSSPYDQVIMKGQFEVYSSGSYKNYMPGGSKYGSEKYQIAKQAVIDGFNGIRNNKYLGFRAWWISSYSDKYIVSGGNRYGYN